MNKTFKKAGLAAIVSLSLVTAAEADNLVLKASHNATASEPYQVGLEQMSQLLQQKTNGEASVHIFPNAQLGDEMDSVQGTMLGTVDLAVAANGTLVNFAPQMSVLSMPYLFKGREQMNQTLDSDEIYDRINGILEPQGLHLVSLFSAGTRHIMSKTPINSIDDIQGMKIRTIQDDAQIKTFRLFGANPTPLPYKELYGALETGVVDGADAANTNYLSQRFYEVSPNWAMVSWLELISPVVMSQSRFDSLPEDVQEALTEAGKTAGNYERKVYQQSDDAAFEKLQDQDVTITHPDIAPFRARAEKVYPDYVTTDAQKSLLNLLQGNDS